MSGARVHVLFVLWACFAVFVYSRFSQLGDSDAYSAGGYMDSTSMRTVMITTIASTLNRLTGVPLVAHLVFGSFAAAGMAYMASAVPGAMHWSWWAIVGNPNFGTWSAIVGREALLVGLLGYCLGATLRSGGHPRGIHAWVALACGAGAFFIREGIGGAVLLFVIASIAWPAPRMPVISAASRRLITMAIVTWLVAVMADDIVQAINHSVLPKAKSYFTVHSPTTRTWINLDTIDDYLTSMVWLLPLSLVGPTPAEVFSRPEMAPSMIGGVAVLLVVIDAMLATATAPQARIARSLRWAWLPGIVVILLCYMPFGVYNPGSGIRYAASFLPFLLYPRMLLKVVRP